MNQPPSDELLPEPPDDTGMTRRTFIAVGGATVAISVVPFREGNAREGREPQPGTPATDAPPKIKVAFEVNGERHELEVDPRMTLLDALRENLRLTGTKKGCDHGQCGACTVMVNGRRINSCLTLAVMHEGDKVTTIEGLGTPDHLHPMQAAFVKCDGYQCGYCTAGQICSAVSVLKEIKDGIPSHATADLTVEPKFSTDEVRERMSGNICRCGAYSNIVEAITEVAEGKHS